MINGVILQKLQSLENVMINRHLVDFDHFRDEIVAYVRENDSE
jgi:hypothetical protein